MIRTVRDAIAEQERIEYAMYAPEVGVLAHNTPRQRFYAYIDGQCVERRTREELAVELVRAWDRNVKTGV
jgi:hypothetical protein